MGTSIEVWAHDEAAVAGTHDLFDRVEAVCSRFLPDSELCALNRISGPSSVRLSPVLTDVMDAAARMRELTGGLVDVGLGDLVTEWGYDRSFEDVADLPGPPPVHQTPRWSLEGRILHRGPETAIDLGGIAKGWTADLAVTRGMGIVVSAGGDLRSDHPETTVTVLDPWGETAASVRVGVGALATSSTSRRRWKVGAMEVSHLVDPRTMTPTASPIVTATAVAETAVEAEAGAKAILLLGSDGLAWAHETPWIRAAMVVWHDGSVYATTTLETAA